MNLDIHSQFKTHWKILLAIAVISFLLLASALWGMSFPGVDDYQLFSDPVDVLGGKPYIGIFSQLGLLLWAASAAICYFSAALMKDQVDKQPFRRYLTASGIMCSWMALDDAFLFHEYSPDYFAIQEASVMFLYIAIAFVYYMIFYRTLQITPFIYLILAALFFAFSIASDFYARLFSGNVYLVEEWPKLVGLIFLTVYFYQAGRTFLRSQPGEEEG